MSGFDLRSLQIVKLDILLEVDRICRKYNIKYFLVAGTLLGAIRHKGFIPWDDDIDICMPIDDYRKFCEIALTEMNSEYFLQNYDTDYTGMWFCKIRKNNTTMIETGCEKCNIHNGIWIDIFPLISVKSDEKWLKSVNRNATIIKRVLNVCFESRNPMEKLPLKYKIVRFVPLWLARTAANIVYSSIFKNNKKYEGCYYLWGSPTIFSRFDNDLFDELCEVCFEGHMLFAPKNWDEYLTILYGDYMKLPPVEKRGNGSCHTISIIDLENDYSNYVGKF